MEARSEQGERQRVLPYLLLGLLLLGYLMGQKLKTCSLVTWATTGTMAWAALVLGPPLFESVARTN
jgi:hypothetical protein